MSTIPYARVAAVTGANKGIGFAIVRQLALQYPSSAYNSGPLLIYLTSRDSGRGTAALEAIFSDAQLKKAKVLRVDGGNTDIKLALLDIASKQSIRDFANTLKREHGQIDFFISNAGVALKGFNAEVVDKTMEINYFGALEAIEHMLPLVRDGGRIVAVSSMSGHVMGRLGGSYSEKIAQRFVNSKTPDDITSMMKEYMQAVRAGTHEHQGWPSAAYTVSKAGLVGATRNIARMERARASNTLINSCCPGYVVTDMTRNTGHKTPDQGAQTPVMLALADIKGQTGLFWQHEEAIEW